MKKWVWIGASVITGVFLLSILGQVISFYNFYKIYTNNDQSDLSINNQFITRKNSIGNFSISYPNTWTYFELSHGNHGDLDVIAAIKAQGSSTDILISKKDFPPNRNELVSIWAENRIKTVDGYLPISIQDIKISGYSTKRIEYKAIFSTFLKGKSIFHCYSTYLLTENTGLDFEFCSEEQYWNLSKPVFEKMMESISIE